MGFFLFLYAVFAGVATLRRIDDDQASGTLEQLEMLPVARWRIALEVAAGALAAYLPFTLIAIGLTLFGVRGAHEARTSLELLSIATPVIVMLPLAATLVTLRHRMSWPVRLVALAIGLAALRYGVPWLVCAPVPAPCSSGAWALAMLPCELVAWAVLWRFLTALGGGWSARETARAAGSACCCPFSAGGYPEGWNPLLWRELNTGVPLLGLAFLTGAIYIAAGVTATYRWDSPDRRVWAVLVWIVPWTCVVSALRTSRDRLSGMWGDIALTPVPVSSILWTRVRALVAEALAVAMGWTMVAFVVPGVDASCAPGSQLILGALGISLFGGAAGAVAGFLSGTSGRGVIAAFGGLVLLWLLWFVSFIPTIWMPSFRRSSGSELAIALGTAAIVYGVTALLARRAIDRAIAEQRA